MPVSATPFNVVERRAVERGKQVRERDPLDNRGPFCPSSVRRLSAVTVRKSTLAASDAMNTGARVPDSVCLRVRRQDDVAATAGDREIRNIADIVRTCRADLRR